MFVSSSMTSKVISISENLTLESAKEIMNEKKIRHLPVVDDDQKLIGIVTDRDLRSALPDSQVEVCLKKECMEAIKNKPVKEIMTKNPHTISPAFTIQDALLLFERHKVGAFPVVDDNGKLKGIISVRDLLRAFVNVLGIGEPGTLLCILVEQKIGQMKKIVDAITEEHISFGSILVARYWEEGKRAVFPYLLTNNVSRIKKKLEGMGYTLLEPMKWYLDQLPKQ